jgi:hypothetical protein
MPMIFELVDGGRGVIATAQGELDDAGYLAAVRDNLTLAHDLPQFCYCLADFCGASRVEVSPRAIQAAAELTRKAALGREPFLFAQVGDRDLVYGLVRMFQSYLGELPGETRLFRLRAEAEDWIRQRARECFGVEGLEFR